MTDHKTLDGQEVENLLDEALDAIERNELRALRWGYTGSWNAKEDLLALVEGLGDSIGDRREIIGTLLERSLLFRLPGPGDEDIFRTRFAEGVRLLASLKQRLPWQSSWLDAPNLVSDFRVDLRPRRFPRRDQPAEAVLQELAERFNWSDLQRRVAREMLSPGGLPLDLAAFQTRAMEAILHHRRSDQGVIISSGTGSGKTLAYYLPAIASISPLITEQDWTKGVSVYPRNVLLADQFSQVLKLARAASKHLSRPLRIGTMYGPTPFEASENAVRDWDYLGGRRESANAYVCPFLLCPECGNRMVWRSEDLRNRIERLVCERRLLRPRGCNVRVGEEEISLTRQSAQRRPPDLLFTTIETMNQRMSDPWSKHLFGLDDTPGPRPQFILLDEVHTYEGTPGAQAAFVLRRWRHAVGSNVRWVGLSATLGEAESFFSQLTGVAEHLIREVAPNPDEFEVEAAEYQVLLRGDPVSQAALLSTSIQASFLLSRLLDPPSGMGSGGRAGERLFVFTDDLDVTNRLFDNLRDAERPAPRSWERSSSPHPPLAALREPKDNPERLAAGQDWRSLQRIGWDLNEPLEISRTSSQDSGVSDQSDIVVATGALEVGFNDLRVGGVLQHKSPRGISSFVQRKGRAGRTRIMRPWMLTILSDYGRDRVTYQEYEQLFDPLVPHQRLPIQNGHIRRIQAGFAFVDWLAKSHPVAKHPKLKGWWWWAVNGPPGRRQDRRRQQEATLKLLDDLYAGNKRLVDSLASHLRGALKLDDEELDDVLWRPPRSLMMEFLPTLRRRLAGDWQLAVPTSHEARDVHSQEGPPRPMPDFLPSSLFQDLNLPEVAIELPFRDSKTNSTPESMMIDHALRHLAPGRVTRRFAHNSPGVHHWIPVPVTDNGETHKLAIDEYAVEFSHVTDAPIMQQDRVAPVPIYRPWKLRISEARTPQSPHRTQRQLGSEPVILPSSNARMNWSNQIMSYNRALAIKPEHDRTWNSLVDAVEFFLHERHAPVTVRRFALGATAEVRRAFQGKQSATDPRDRTLTVHTEFRAPGTNGGPAGVGFEAEVDAMCVRFRLPEIEDLLIDAQDAPSLPSWRVAFLRDRIQTDSELPESANTFLRGWLHQILFSALVEIAADHDCGLDEALEVIVGEGMRSAFQRVMDTIFGVRPDADSIDIDEIDEEESAGLLRERISLLVDDECVIVRLGELASVLWKAEPEAFAEWLSSRLHETLGEATLAACFDVAPRHVTEDSLLLDLGRGIPGKAAPSETVEVWITESAIGGAGAIEAIEAANATEPRRFLRALEAALVPGGAEITSVGLDRTVELAIQHTETAEAIRDVRVQRNPERREQALGRLYAHLSRAGIFMDHGTSVALNQRLLRDGTDTSTDELLNDLREYWSSLERRLGVAIDLRIFCYLGARSQRFNERVAALVERNTGREASLAEQVGVLAGLLWPRPHEARRRVFESWSPFRERGFTDQALARELIIAEQSQSVAFGEPEWYAGLRTALRNMNIACLRVDRSDVPSLTSELLRIIAEPVDVGFLQFFPTIEQVRWDGSHLLVTLVLQESIS